MEALNKKLFNAAQSGDLKGAEECLRNGADVHYKDGLKKQTPLHVALQNGFKDMAALLVSKGADIKIQYNFELLNAAESGDLKAAEECLKNGADVHFEDGWNKQTPLHRAAKGDHTAIASLLISSGADIHSQDGNKQTPLYVALENDHKDMAALLLSKGADIKIQYNFELLNAAKRGDLKAAEECLKNGADVHYKDGWIKQTPLHKAAKGDQTDMASLLISAGADIHSQDAIEQTPLHVALEHNHKDMGALLLSKGADIKIQYNCVCIYKGKIVLLHFTAELENINDHRIMANMLQNSMSNFIDL